MPEAATAKGVEDTGTASRWARCGSTLLAEAFERTIDALTDADADYALIGGFAVAHHGLPRPTRHIDILLKVPRVYLPGLLERLRARGFEFVLEDVLEQLRDDRLSTVRYRGIRVDFLEAVVPLFARAVDRARTVDIGGLQVRVARAEELIALKMVACREDDARDVKGILATQGEGINLEDIRESLRECCEPDRLELFERLARETPT